MGSNSSKPQEHFPCREHKRSRAGRNRSKSDDMGCLEACIVDDVGIEDDSDTSLRWPGNVIHYQIDESLVPHPKITTRINEAINQFHKQTLVKFIPYQPHKGIRDWILFQYDPEITDSNVGRQKGEQTINVSPYASKGSIMHEIMHALGFYHEHSRNDRDKVIEVNLSIIPEDYLDNYLFVGIPIGKYDPDSIMHYSVDNTILKAKSQLLSKRMGQREGFSEGDLNALKYLCLSPCCTYDVYKDDHFVQNQYECITCWGSGSAYGACKYCIEKCHSGHDTKPHELLKDIETVCHCGRNRHIVPTCTRITTGEVRVNQMFYICYDCFDVEEYERRKNSTPVVCKPCFMKCHEGHRYKEFGLTDGYCDCGKSYCKIICKVI